MNRIALILLTFMLITSCSVKNKLGQNQLEIHDLQGCSHISPYNGQHVSGIQGVVTHKYNNGFSMQSINPDDKPCSSEGIFVLTGQFPEEVPGDLVSVSGVVNEFSAGSEEDYNLSRTEIHNPSIIFISKYQELPSPVILDSPEYIIPNEVIENDGLKIFDPLEDGLDYYESLEFMIVEIQKGLVVGPKNEYTEIVLLPISKLDKNIISINGAVVDRKFDKNPERIMVKLAQGDNQNITLGDMTASKVVGIMDYSFGNYKIFLNSKLSIEPATHETNVFQKDPNSITIASYNVENLSIYDDESKFYTIAKQIVQSLGSPDILLLHEIMDDSGTIDDGTISSNVSLTKLINAIIEKGGPDYEFFDNPPVNNQDGGVAGGNIRTVAFFRTDRGISLEASVNQISPITYADGLFSINKNPYRFSTTASEFSNTRKPALWLFRKEDTQIPVISVHLTSQSANSPLWGNAQPPLKPEEGKRINQAEAISEFAEDIFIKNGQAYFFIVGDINDDPWSKTVQQIEGDHLLNLGKNETENERYSFIFDGNATQLDYIFMNKNVIDEHVKFIFVHINSFNMDEHRISDHDPVIASFLLPH